MKFNMIKNAVAASVLFAIAGGAQADILSGFDATFGTGANDGHLFISILRNDPTSPESMIIDTNLSLFDLASGAITSWTSDDATTAAVSAFLGTSDISNFVFNAGGVTQVDFFEASVDAAFNFATAFYTTTNVDPIQFPNLQELETLRGNIDTFITTINNEFDGDVITGILPTNFSFHDNDFLWSNDIGGSFFDTEGNVGSPLALWNFFNGSDEIFALDIQWDLMGFLNVDATTGVVSFNNGDVAVIPVPAAAWLFGTGLLGLIGVARRKA